MQHHRVVRDLARLLAKRYGKGHNGPANDSGDVQKYASPQQYKVKGYGNQI